MVRKRPPLGRELPFPPRCLVRHVQVEQGRLVPAKSSVCVMMAFAFCTAGRLPRLGSRRVRVSPSVASHMCLLGALVEDPSTNVREAGGGRRDANLGRIPESR